jgi:hypothetical protein
VKDKTFIFGDYEGVRQSKSQSANVNAPSANARHRGPLLNGNVGDIRVIFFDGGAKYNSFQSQIQVKGLRGFMGHMPRSRWASALTMGLARNSAIRSLPQCRR